METTRRDRVTFGLFVSPEIFDILRDANEENKEDKVFLDVSISSAITEFVAYRKRNLRFRELERERRRLFEKEEQK